MRKALSLLALVAALLAPAASASPIGKTAPPPVICGTACDGGGGGWTGCTQDSAGDSGGLPYVAAYHHVLVVSYCKRYGVITSISIVAHYCDTSGFIGCLGRALPGRPAAASVTATRRSPAGRPGPGRSRGRPTTRRASST